jgi:hypothetical protein
MSAALLREMFEQMVIAKDGRIHRVWETTWPSWRTVEGFADY